MALDSFSSTTFTFTAATLLAKFNGYGDIDLPDRYNLKLNRITAGMFADVTFDPATGTATVTTDADFTGEITLEYTLKDSLGAVSNVATVALDRAIPTTKWGFYDLPPFLEGAFELDDARIATFHGFGVPNTQVVIALRVKLANGEISVVESDTIDVDGNGKWEWTRSEALEPQRWYSIVLLKPGKETNTRNNGDVWVGRSFATQDDD